MSEVVQIMSNFSGYKPNLSKAYVSHYDVCAGLLTAWRQVYMFNVMQFSSVCCGGNVLLIRYLLNKLTN